VCADWHQLSLRCVHPGIEVGNPPGYRKPGLSGRVPAGPSDRESKSTHESRGSCHLSITQRPRRVPQLHGKPLSSIASDAAKQSGQDDDAFPRGLGLIGSQETLLRMLLSSQNHVFLQRIVTVAFGTESVKVQSQSVGAQNRILLDASRHFRSRGPLHGLLERLPRGEIVANEILIAQIAVIAQIAFTLAGWWAKLRNKIRTAIKPFAFAQIGALELNKQPSRASGTDPKKAT
jgi:hypothetical protein